MRKKSLPTLTLASFLGLLSVGCDHKPSAANARPAASVANKPLAGRVAGLSGELKELGKACHSAAKDELTGTDGLSCSGGENWKLASDFLSKKRDRSAAVGPLAAALAGPEAGARSLAQSALRVAFGGAWSNDTAAKPVDPEAARALLAVALQLPENMAKDVLPAAVNAAMLADQADWLCAELAKPPPGPLQEVAYPYLMAFGRLKAFPKVQEVVQKSPLALALAALEAPRSLHHWSDAEEKAICDWSETLLSDPRPEVVQGASVLMGNCGPAWLDKLLARADKQAARGTLDLKAEGALITLSTLGKDTGPHDATSDQRARARSLLMGVALSTKADAKARASALLAVSEIWPDPAARAMLKQLQHDGSSEVAKQATDALGQMPDGTVATSAP